MLVRQVWEHEAGFMTIKKAFQRPAAATAGMPNFWETPPPRQAQTYYLKRAGRWLLGAEDRILGGLGHAELHDPLGRNFDGFAGGRVAAHALLAVHQHQLA